MKTSAVSLVVAVLGLVSCETPPVGDSSSFYYASANPQPPPAATTGSTATRSTAPVPRSGYAPGSGPTAMPQGDQFIHQQNVTGPFGSHSSSTVIQSTGGVQSYQTIGGVPVYPGTVVPGYRPGQPYFGAPGAQQPVFVPGVGGQPGYYLNPGTGARVRP